MAPRAHHAPVLLLALATMLPASPATAVPPAGAAIGTAALPKAHWIKHRVIPGERIAEITGRYGIRTTQLIRWNKLNAKRPRIRAGQELRIRTRGEAVVRERIRYKVRRGDSWARIAKKHGVDRKRLRKYWNRGKGKGLRAGDTVIVWVEPEPEVDASEALPGPTPQAQDNPALPTIPIPQNGRSVGSPSRGRLVGGVRLPDNPALYTVRKPAHSYGSSHTIGHLQDAIATFRTRTGFDRELVIGDISRKRGGRFRPHRSHRTGRDVDIRLPLAAGVAKGTVPHGASEVDWDAAWALMRAILDTGQVEYIFLSRSRQRALLRAAKRAGTPEKELTTLIQFPNRAPHAVVRHSRGHIKHFHVRFRCGAAETRCRTR